MEPHYTWKSAQFDMHVGAFATETDLCYPQPCAMQPNLAVGTQPGQWNLTTPAEQHHTEEDLNEQQNGICKFPILPCSKQCN